MATHRFFLLDAFTRARYSGNPAGVVLPNDSLTDEQMQRVAGELGRESAFLWPTADEADYRVVYYTGTRRIPLCGHDTVAAATVLAYLASGPALASLHFTTDVGVLPIEIHADQAIWMTQALPSFGAQIDAGVVAHMLSLNATQVLGTPQVISTGSPFLIVQVRERATLNMLQPDMRSITKTCDQVEALGMYLWTRDTEGKDAYAHARCFAPGAGLPEDPVTGSASGALGASLLRQGEALPDADGVLVFSTEQGYAMGRPGSAQVRVESRGGEVTRVRVGGHAVLVAEGHLSI